MPILVDCPGCAVLIRGDERSCPFCGVTLQRTTGVVAVLGLALGLMTASCGDKDGPSSDATVSVSSTTANTSTSDSTGSSTTVETGDFPTPTTAYAGPTSSVSESETNDPSVGSAYAVSGDSLDSVSVSDGTDTSGSSGSTGSTGDASSTGSTGDAGSTGDTGDTSGGSTT